MVFGWRRKVSPTIKNYVSPTKDYVPWIFPQLRQYKTCTTWIEKKFLSPSGANLERSPLLSISFIVNGYLLSVLKENSTKNFTKSVMILYWCYSKLGWRSWFLHWRSWKKIRVHGLWLTEKGVSDNQKLCFANQRPCTAIFFSVTSI